MLTRIGDDLHQLEKDFDLQQLVENIDNNSRKNKLWLKGGREGAEGSDLKQFLEDVFTLEQRTRLLFNFFQFSGLEVEVGL